MNNDEAYLAGYRAASNTWSEEFSQLKNVKPNSQASRGFCYMIHLKDNIIKIGFSHTADGLVERWNVLSDEYSYRVHPVAVEPGGYFREQYLHRIFNEERIPGPGERFLLTERIKRRADLGFNRLVIPQIEAWYGDNFFDPVLIGSIVNTAKSLNAIKPLKHANSSYNKYLLFKESGDRIEVSGSLDINGLVQRTKSNLGNFDFRDEPNLERKVWSMEF